MKKARTAGGPKSREYMQRAWNWLTTPPSIPPDYVEASINQEHDADKNKSTTQPKSNASTAIDLARPNVQSEDQQVNQSIVDEVEQQSVEQAIPLSPKHTMERSTEALTSRKSPAEVRGELPVPVSPLTPGLSVPSSSFPLSTTLTPNITPKDAREAEPTSPTRSKTISRRGMALVEDDADEQIALPDTTHLDGTWFGIPREKRVLALQHSPSQVSTDTFDDEWERIERSRGYYAEAATVSTGPGHSRNMSMSQESTFSGTFDTMASQGDTTFVPKDFSVVWSVATPPELVPSRQDLDPVEEAPKQSAHRLDSPGSPRQGPRRDYLWLMIIASLVLIFILSITAVVAFAVGLLDQSPTPTASPTRKISNNPSPTPSETPSTSPQIQGQTATSVPILATNEPTLTAKVNIFNHPTSAPESESPSNRPSLLPSSRPSRSMGPTLVPSTNPSRTFSPSVSSFPSDVLVPSRHPSTILDATDIPSSSPTWKRWVIEFPSISPQPSSLPTGVESSTPCVSPTPNPTIPVSSNPSRSSPSPSISQPSNDPSTVTLSPSTSIPTKTPTKNPTALPTQSPTTATTQSPTSIQPPQAASVQPFQPFGASTPAVLGR